jgi:hypothetical protein
MSTPIDDQLSWEPADRELREVLSLESEGWTPDTYVVCSCGSTYAAVSDPITITEGERAAVREALGGLDAAGLVLDAINRERAREDARAVQEWKDDHADCAYVEAGDD